MADRKQNQKNSGDPIKHGCFHSCLRIKPATTRYALHPRGACQSPHELVEELETVVERFHAQLLVAAMRVTLTGRAEDAAHAIGRDAGRTKEPSVGGPGRHRWDDRDVAEHLV